jgi:hypothetical protein
MTTVAFAQPSGDPFATHYTALSKASSAPSASRSIRADAYPSMNAVLWYAPAEADAYNQLCQARDLRW